MGGQETAWRIVIGCLLLCVGWRLYRFGIKAMGFYFGFLAGAVVWELVLALTEGKVDLPRGDTANIAAGIVLGIIAAYLSYRLYNSILWTAVIGGCLYLAYATSYLDPIYRLVARTGALPTLEETLGNFLPAVMAMFVALPVILLHRYIVITATAGTGAHLLASVTPYPILFFPFFLVGVGIQAGTRLRRRQKVLERQET